MSEPKKPKTPPGIYRHHKRGEMYRVLMVAKMSTNTFARENMVVYVSLRKGSINVRHENEFNEIIGYNDNTPIRRFEFVANEDLEDG